MQAGSPTPSPAATPSKVSSSSLHHPNGGVGSSDHHHLGPSASSSSSSSPPTSHSRAISKRLQALSFSKLKHTHAKASSDAGSSGSSGVGGKGGDRAQGVAGSSVSEADGSSPVHSLDLEREEFPGGDAMLEVLTRLQTYQESMQMQLQVCKRVIVFKIM